MLEVLIVNQSEVRRLLPVRDCIDVMARAASCDDFCRQVDRQAVDAECGTVLDDFLRCRNGATDVCSLRTCPDETNRLTVCVLTYCDDFSDSARALCSAW